MKRTHTMHSVIDTDPTREESSPPEHARAARPTPSRPPRRAAFALLGAALVSSALAWSGEALAGKLSAGNFAKPQVAFAIPDASAGKVPKILLTGPKATPGAPSAPPSAYLKRSYGRLVEKVLAKMDSAHPPLVMTAEDFAANKDRLHKASADAKPASTKAIAELQDGVLVVRLAGREERIPFEETSTLKAEQHEAVYRAAIEQLAKLLVSSHDRPQMIEWDESQHRYIVRFGDKTVELVRAEKVTEIKPPTTDERLVGSSPAASTTPSGEQAPAPTKTSGARATQRPARGIARVANGASLS